MYNVNFTISSKIINPNNQMVQNKRKRCEPNIVCYVSWESRDPQPHGLIWVQKRALSSPLHFFIYPDLLWYVEHEFTVGKLLRSDMSVCVCDHLSLCTHVKHRPDLLGVEITGLTIWKGTVEISIHEFCIHLLEVETTFLCVPVIPKLLKTVLPFLLLIWK